MIDVRETDEFVEWIQSLRDSIGQKRILYRIRKLQATGHWGDVKTLKGTGGIKEMRIDSGPGYRVYAVQTGRTIVILLCGGDKSSQDADMHKAARVAARLSMEQE